MSVLALVLAALGTDLWPSVVPETKVVTESQVRPVGPYWQAKVALTNEVTTRFTLEDVPIEGWLQFGGPNTTAWVNGREIAKNGYFREIICWDVRSLLVKGANEIVLQNANTADWARWTIGELYVRYKSGVSRKICCGDDLPQTLQASNPPLPPYEGTIRLPYSDLTHLQCETSATAMPSAVAGGDVVVYRFGFRGDSLPEFPFEAQLVYREGGTIRWTDRVLIARDQVVSHEGREWTLEVRAKAPRYLRFDAAQVRLESSAVFTLNPKKLAATVRVTPSAVDPRFPRPVRASVARVGGQSVFALDGRPFYAFWGYPHLDRPDFTRRHSDAPVNLVTIGRRCDAWWPKEGVFDFSVFDRDMEDVSVDHPTAYVMVNLSLYPPPDWVKAHPDEMACDEEGRVPVSWYGPYSFASDAALALLEDALTRAIDHLEHSPYANRIIGYRVNSGNTNEWLGWDPPAGWEHPLDFSKAACRGFGRAIPPPAARRPRKGEELLWEEREHREAIDFNRYVSDVTADGAIRLCRTAKRLLGGRKLVGTYYGYVMTLWGAGLEQMRGHWSLKRLIDSKAVDFLMSPQPYSVRNLGDTYGDMKPFATLSANGIVPVIEDDTRTFSALRLPLSMLDNLQMPTERTSVDILRRNLGFTLCRLQIPYYLPLISGTEFDFPQFGSDATAAQKVGAELMREGCRRSAEIAVVVSEETVKAMPALGGFVTSAGEEEQIYRPDGTVLRRTVSGAPFAFDPFCSAYTRYACIGAPVDYVLAEDLRDHPGDYKLYVFVNCYHADAAFRAAVERLKARACTLLWLSAPGYMDAAGNSLAAMERLTGFSFVRRPGAGQPVLRMADGRMMGARGSAVAPLFAVTDGERLGAWDDGSAGAAVKRTGKATGVFCGTYQPDLAFLRDVAARAGVHVYSADGDPVEANEALVCLHARTQGRKTITLPCAADVEDVFGGKTVARGVRTFSFDAPLHSSWLFRLRRK